MINVSDLNIEEELLPLFDYSQNAFTQQVLSKWFHQLPATVEEVMERQQIINTLVNSPIEPVRYYKTDLHEVHSFLTSIHESNLFNLSSAELITRLLFFPTERGKVRSGIIQAIILFHKLNSGYFHRLSIMAFPASFQNVLNKILDFFGYFELEKNRLAIQNNKFGNSHIVHIISALKKQVATIQPFWEQLFLFEVYLSISIAHQKLALQFPFFTEQQFFITDFYHPILKTPVKNSVHKTHNILLLTGPNMAGKSTLLKAISICVYLGHLGCGVPASACEMSFFKSVSVAINLKDDLQSGYSHFLKEIKTLKEVVLVARDKPCFAVFDELFRGTNIEDALDILKATIQGLSKFSSSFFIISTHLHQLQQLINPVVISPYYIACTVNEGKPTFTYQLRQGWSTLKLGRALFEIEGLSKLLISDDMQ